MRVSLVLTAALLIPALSAPAHAGTVVWLEGTPDPALTPDHTARLPAQVAAAPVFGERDTAAMRTLAAEVQACRPLLDEFDGELAILRRIEAALDGVEVVRPADVDAVWQALVLQGLAVHRYFPDRTVPEAASAGAVRTVAGSAENRPWLDAVALDSARQPTEAELPDPDARIAYQELRARVLLQPSAAVELTGLPPGAALLVDGAPVAGSRAQLVPGRHRLTVEVEGRIHLRERLELDPGATASVPYRAVARELAAVAPALHAAKGAVPLPVAVVQTLDTLDQPVSVVVQGKRGPRVFRVVDGLATPAVQAPSEASQDGLQLGVSGAVAWVYDGDWLLQNAAAGAPEEASTVNAAGGVLGADLKLPVGPLHVGAGTDLVLPVGAHHTLPSGDRELRLRAHSYGALGWGPLQATVGWWSPWHLAAGARASVVLHEQWSLTSVYIHGFGLDRPRDDGSVFSPAASRAGWLGVRWGWAP